MPDMINQPPHYVACRPRVEPIDLTESLGFNLGNAIKYISRAGKKDGSSYEQDLRKAVYYLRREIDLMEKNKLAAGVCDEISTRGLSYFFWMLAERPYLEDYFFVNHDSGRDIYFLEWTRPTLQLLVRTLEQMLNGLPQEDGDE